MKLFSVIIALAFSNLSFSIGGIWLQEVFFLHNNSKYHGYVICDHWIQSHTALKSSFLEVYKMHNAKVDSLTIYFDVTDWSNIKENATFPMHQFSVNQANFSRFSFDDIKLSATGKLLSNIDYHIEVLSPICEEDISWYDDKSEVYYPVGEEVGCRLEVYMFHESAHTSHLIQELGKLYLGEEPDKLQLLTRSLYRRKVVVVELCGC